MNKGNTLLVLVIPADKRVVRVCEKTRRCTCLPGETCALGKPFMPDRCGVLELIGAGHSVMMVKTDGK